MKVAVCIPPASARKDKRRRLTLFSYDTNRSHFHGLEVCPASLSSYRSSDIGSSIIGSLMPFHEAKDENRRGVTSFGMRACPHTFIKELIKNYTMKEEKLCIENTELDQKLLDGGVRFLPWIGKDYDKGLSYDNDGKLILGTEENPGKKILVLGESHYIEDYDPDEDISHFTRDVICNYVDLDSPFQRWMNTFTKFIRALYGEDMDRAQCAGLFSHLAFYNYLQVPISGPRMAGNNDDYEKAQAPFFNLLEKIKPDVVIIWGNRLWEYLPDGHGFDWYKEYALDDDTHRSGKYVVNGKDVVLIPIYHPSVGFSYEYWNKVICHLL